MVNSFPAPTLVGSTDRGSRFPFALQRPHGAKVGVAKNEGATSRVLKVG